MNQTLIEFFDPDPIHNLIEILLLRPSRAVFLYDPQRVTAQALDHLETACRAAIPSFAMERRPVSFESLSALERECAAAAKEHPCCIVDLTGGGELPAIAAYQVCAARGLPLLQVEVRTCRVIEILPPAPVIDRTRPLGLSLEMLLAARGAACGGHAHTLPSAECFGEYLSFCCALFDDLDEWKSLCRYLQAGATQLKKEGEPLHFSAPCEITAADGRRTQVSLPLLQSAERFGLIEHLRDKYENISFAFADATAKKYLTDFGVWLEFFCYQAIAKEPNYFDKHMSLRVDWQAERKTPPVVNEIDVTFMCGEKPVFLSCKLSEPPVEALYELSMYARYFGGVTSKCALVMMAEEKPNSPLSARAQEMGILIVGRNTILSGQLQPVIDRFVRK